MLASILEALKDGLLEKADALSENILDCVRVLSPDVSLDPEDSGE